MSNIDNQALRERYSEKPAPKCHICGSVMTIQRAGAGGVVYGCTGRIDKDGEGYKFAEGRDFADDHYARSRVTVADESDPDMLALLDEPEASEKRIAEFEASHGNLREAMAGIHNTIRGEGAYTPLAAILNASKRAYEESASAAGKGE
ncbi:ead/Ea22-like family protein [Enterobacter hormaechei]|uniref:ead/Ea22-like family protein n=1 Tax=Enterobacter hormaechei TaxID=158836 RepID=UPI001C9B9A5B|nr:ead/Ea22-like family protein [Enterobacter hormaechei]MBY7159149.1 ead/Ea22-like family protein [Enterobacter hormaechei]